MTAPTTKFVLVDEENDMQAFGLYPSVEAATLAATTGKLSKSFEGEPWGDPNTYRGHPHRWFKSWKVQTLEEFNARADRPEMDLTIFNDI